MFEGYYGRRRLKSALALLLAFLIAVTLVYQRQSKILIIYTSIKFLFDHISIFFRRRR
jgi:hypothetical protein